MEDNDRVNSDEWFTAMISSVAHQKAESMGLLEEEDYGDCIDTENPDR